MAEAAQTRLIGEFASPDISKKLRDTSILCLPLGATEQHGPHLPLETDTVIAEELTRLLVARFGDEFDLWRLPVISVGLSREHAWAEGTKSLSISAFVTLLRDLAQNLARTLPARNLLIVNGHGGNRGILQNLIYELQDDFGFNVCVLHPFVLSKIAMESALPEIHAGKDETSVMLAIAPHLVRMDRVSVLKNPPKKTAVERFILDQGVSWAWSSGDKRIADQGVTGEAHAASAELGKRIIESILTEARPVLSTLLENQRRK